MLTNNAFRARSTHLYSLPQAQETAAEEERVNRRVGAYFRFDDALPEEDEEASKNAISISSLRAANATKSDFMDTHDYNEWGGISVPQEWGLLLLRQLGIRKTVDGNWIWKKRKSFDEKDPVVKRIPSQVIPHLKWKPRVGVGFTASSLTEDMKPNVNRRSVAGFSLRDDDDDNVYDQEDADNDLSSIWNRIHNRQQEGPSSLKYPHRNVKAANLVAYEPDDDSDPEDSLVVGTRWTKLNALSDRLNTAEQPLPGFAKGSPCIQRYFPGPDVPVNWNIRQVRPAPMATRLPSAVLPLPPLPISLPLPPFPAPFVAALPPPIVSLPRPLLPPPIVPLPRPPIVQLPQPPLPTESTPMGPWAADVRAAMQARFAMASNEEFRTDDRQTIAAVPPADIAEDSASYFTRSVQTFTPESLLCKRFLVIPTRPL